MLLRGATLYVWQMLFRSFCFILFFQQARFGFPARGDL